MLLLSRCQPLSTNKAAPHKDVFCTFFDVSSFPKNTLSEIYIVGWWIQRRAEIMHNRKQRVNMSHCSCILCFKLSVGILLSSKPCIHVQDERRHQDIFYSRGCGNKTAYFSQNVRTSFCFFCKSLWGQTRCFKPKHDHSTLTWVLCLRLTRS